MRATDWQFGDGWTRLLPPEAVTDHFADVDYDHRTRVWRFGFTERAEEYLALLRAGQPDSETVEVVTRPRSQRALDALADDVRSAKDELGRRLVSAWPDTVRGIVEIQVVSDDHRYTSLEVARRWGDDVELELVDELERCAIPVRSWKPGPSGNELTIGWNGDADADIEIDEHDDRIDVIVSELRPIGIGTTAEGRPHHRRTMTLKRPVGDRNVRDASGVGTGRRPEHWTKAPACNIPAVDLTAEIDGPLVLDVGGWWWAEEQRYVRSAAYAGVLPPGVRDALPAAFSRALADVVAEPWVATVAHGLEVHEGHFGHLRCWIALDPAVTSWLSLDRFDQVASRMLRLVNRAR